MSDSSRPTSDPFSALQSLLRLPLQGSVQELIEEAQKAAATWMRHRQEATEAAARSLQSIWGCKDPGALASVWSDWLTKNMELAAKEMRDAQEQAFRWFEIGQKSATSGFQSGPEPAEAAPPKPAARSQSVQARSAAE